MRPLLRTAAVMLPLLRNALRVDEACADQDVGHRVPRVVRGRPQGEDPAYPGHRACQRSTWPPWAAQAGQGSDGRSAVPLVYAAITEVTRTQVTAARAGS